MNIWRTRICSVDQLVDLSRYQLLTALQVKTAEYSPEFKEGKVHHLHWALGRVRLSQRLDVPKPLTIHMLTVTLVGNADRTVADTMTNKTLLLACVSWISFLRTLSDAAWICLLT